MWQIWLIIAGICLIVEIMTVGFLVFWFAIGALLAMITSFFTTNLIIQTSVFIISSTILIFATKPLVQKFVKNKNEIKTNVYSTVGKIGIVTKNIDSIEATRTNQSQWRNLVCYGIKRHNNSRRYWSRNQRNKRCKSNCCTNWKIVFNLKKYIKGGKNHVVFISFTCYYFNNSSYVY